MTVECERIRKFGGGIAVIPVSICKFDPALVIPNPRTGLHSNTLSRKKKKGRKEGGRREGRKEREGKEGRQKGTIKNHIDNLYWSTTSEN